MVDGDASPAAYFAGIRQGHVLTVAGTDGVDVQLVVISQTCDVVLPKVPTVTLAKVATPTEDALPRARAGAMPRYVRLPSLDGDLFADMCYIETHAKEELRDLPFTPGIDLDSNERQRDFSLSITRWFGRFPFPDEVVPWLRPVEEEIRKKYTKQGELGQLLNDDVVELRVETDWRVKPYALVLHLVVRAESLPTLDDIGGPADPGFLAKLRDEQGNVLKPSAIAEVLAGTADSLERSLAFEALAEAFASICTPAARHAHDEEIMSAVSSIEGKLWPDDEFPLSQVRKSEPLDLEYLSEASVG
ncbi:MAG: hypothetical protein CMH84_00270 [Nocardioides sp.]|nr:hypothetical protein [Nocardioides sp.]